MEESSLEVGQEIKKSKIKEKSVRPQSSGTVQTPASDTSVQNLSQSKKKVDEKAKSDETPEEPAESASGSVEQPEHTKGKMPLPPINLAELGNILRGPNMPPQIMKEVTEKMTMKSKDYESDDNSVSSAGSVAMKGLFDCILEVSLSHQDSDNESDEEEERPREVPCKFCRKIFGSTVKMRTHILVAHAKQDPSIQNIHNPPGEDKLGMTQDKKSSSKSDCNVEAAVFSRVRRASRNESKHVIVGEEENIPTTRKRISRSLDEANLQQGTRSTKSKPDNESVQSSKKGGEGLKGTAISGSSSIGAGKRSSQQKRKATEKDNEDKDLSGSSSSMGVCTEAVPSGSHSEGSAGKKRKLSTTSDQSSSQGAKKGTLGKTKSGPVRRSLRRH